MARTVTSLEVLRTQRLGPHMIRVVAGGEGLAQFPDTEHTDRYVKILFPPPGATYPEPFDMDAIRRDLPRGQWPSTRTYTVRGLDLAAGELTIDFVHHGDTGLAGPWAAAAAPGDVLRLLGPGGAYAPSPAADWHLLVGDEAAIPAIAAALERLAPGAPAHVLIQVQEAADRQELPSPGAVTLSWLHREDVPQDRADGQLLDAVSALTFPAGSVHAFVHGEAGEVKALRRHLLAERGVPRDALSISGYWRRGRDEDGFRLDKAAERAAEEAAAEGASAGR